jgi:hypothetical protein
MRGHGEKILPGGCKEQFEKKNETVVKFIDHEF